MLKRERKVKIMIKRKTKERKTDNGKERKKKIKELCKEKKQKKKVANHLYFKKILLLETRVQRVKKIFDTSLIDTQHYKVWIKGKLSNPGSEQRPPLYHNVVTIEKGIFRSPLSTVSQLT